jgi:Na+/proline symporter/signal transduction histidine kinase
MLGFWFVSIAAIGYLGLLFAIAWFGDKHAARLRNTAWQPIIYALSLAVFCTAWSFYGAVGRSAIGFYDFVLVCAGPMLMMLLGYPLLRKMVRTAHANNVTSVADFIGARYGKSQTVAALATVIAVVGVLPYIALQLQAVSLSFDALLEGIPSPTLQLHRPPVWKDTALHATLMMILFAILFGVRHVHASERHQGMTMAIAFESLVKLGAFIGVGLFVLFYLFDGPADFAAKIAARPRVVALFQEFRVQQGWIAITLLSALAFLCLPRQFHVAAVENDGNPKNLRTAAWVFPSYLVAISLFVPVLAVASWLVFRGQTNPVLAVLRLPMAADQSALALIAFLGGLSAATAMIIVEVVALSTMICNEIIMPILSRKAALRDSSRRMMPTLVLGLRRGSVVAILLCAYAYHRMTGSNFSLSSIGLISFAAVAQFAPAMIAGLYWRRAHRYGAVAGMAGGALIWAHEMFLPSLIKAGWLTSLADFMPPSLPALLPGVDNLTNYVIWSLLTNVSLLVGVSLLARSNERDRLQADTFVGGNAPTDEAAVANPARASTFEPLRNLAERLVGRDLATRAFAGPVEKYRDKDLAAYTERLLSGAIGAASAHIMVTAVLQKHRSLIGNSNAILAEASEAILFNHDLLRATLENVTQGIGMFDAERRLAAWNRRFLELLSIDEAQAHIGTPVQLMLSPQIRGTCDLARLLKGCSSANPRAAQTMQQRLPDGRMLEFQVNPMQAGGFVLVCTDITEQIRTLEALRESEKHIREANESLELRVAERTRELTLLNEQLAVAKREAEAASVGKTRFLAAASHDLLQPLHVARILAGALSEGRRAGKSTALLHQLDQALGAVDELLQTLLDISKLDAGALRPELRSVDLHTLLTNIAASFQPIAAQRGLRLRVAASHAVVVTDPALFRRILQNFLSNALRYTQKGKVLLGCRRRGERIVVEVWDTGIGIPDDQLPVIFEEFKRGCVNDPQTPPGLGLGLAIVDRIARMLEHPVEVRSWPGRGSVFSVSVPSGNAVPATLLPVADNRLRGSLANKLVLCVDNDPAVLVAMRTLLQGWSCAVLTALDVKAACAEIDRSGATPEIVLMDYHLESDVTGLEALETLAAHTGQRLPGILITANYTEAVREAASDLGYPMLNKPVRPGALRALMTQMLSGEARTRPHPVAATEPMTAVY